MFIGPCFLGVWVLFASETAISNNDAARQVAESIASAFRQHEIGGWDIEIRVRKGRQIDVVGRVPDMNALKVLVDTLSGNEAIETLVLNVGVGRDPMPGNSPMMPMNASRNRSRPPDWTDGAWLRDFRVH